MCSVDCRLKQGEEARTLTISLEGLECAGELSAALTTHAEQLTVLYRELHALTTAGQENLDVYEPLFERATILKEWFQARKRVANSMKAANAKAKAKAAAVPP